MNDQYVIKVRVVRGLYAYMGEYGRLVELKDAFIYQSKDDVENGVMWYTMTTNYDLSISSLIEERMIEIMVS